jgi:nicotinamidase-related amidase
MQGNIQGEPHQFPLRGTLQPHSTALFVIDMQHDFLSEGGYMDRLGADLSCMREAIGPIRAVLASARAWGCRIVHTREGYAADLSDLQPWKLGGAPGDAVAIGDKGPRGRALIRGEPGFDIIPGLAPRPGEAVFDKPSYGAFVSTRLGAYLKDSGVTHVVFTGVTTDCCVTSTLREALDRGFECLVLSDCVGSANRAHHEAALALMRKPSGVFGTTSSSNAFIAALQ